MSQVVAVFSSRGEQGTPSLTIGADSPHEAASLAGDEVVSLQQCRDLTQHVFFFLGEVEIRKQQLFDRA
jgi:hypothetical protein